jgi:sulfur-carrier protein adenylyltransferase/sulfurtransferase
MTGKGRGGKVQELFPDDLKEYMDRHQEGTYLLLDVRQPEEYEESRLPGSKLVPLPLLPDSLDELDRRKDTIVYCSMGGRSAAAAQFLAVRGFENVFQLQGGLDAWEDTTAEGPAGFHLEFIRGSESAEEAARVAYRMESGLEQFHRAALDKTGSLEVKGLLRKLVKAEESHMRKLLELLQSLGSEPGTAVAADDRMEGGLDIYEFLNRNEHYLQSSRGCLELAMMIETQALDLYLRMAQACADSGAAAVFFGIGDEEKSHLSALGDLLSTELKKPDTESATT